MRDQRPIAIDLFCGAGGMSLGFEQAGFDVVAAVDQDPVHVATHASNFPKCKTIQADVSRLTGSELRQHAELTEHKQIDVLFGGPPCQGFSTMGKRAMNDPRNQLLQEFARLAMELRPKYFVVENVAGLLAHSSRPAIDSFVQKVAAHYDIVVPIKILDALDYGVPQHRRRVFILGFAKDEATPQYPVAVSPETPSFENMEGGFEPRVTVWDAIGDLSNVGANPQFLNGDVYTGELGLPSPYAKYMRDEIRHPHDLSYLRPSRAKALSGCLLTVHTDEMIDRFAKTPVGSYEPISRYYRLTKTGVAPTLRAGTDSSRGSFTAPRPIHPVHPRCITVREAARLHSIPDWFTLNRTNWHGFRQVGNAVPPRLACALARTLMATLTGG